MKLYVDFVSTDHSMAVTTNDSLIRYNLRKLKRFSDDYTHIFAMGRYVCLFVAKDMSMKQMLFMDFRKNESGARELIDLLQFQEAIRRKFISLIELWNADYEANYDMLELIKVNPY